MFTYKSTLNLIQIFHNKYLLSDSSSLAFQQLVFIIQSEKQRKHVRERTAVPLKIAANLVNNSSRRHCRRVRGSSIGSQIGATNGNRLASSRTNNATCIQLDIANVDHDFAHF